MGNVTKKEILSFWNTHPLGSYEIKSPLGSKEYFQGLKKLREASSKFVMDFYEFKNSQGKRILDVGCEPGWVSFNYARNGADIYSIDLTPKAIEIIREWFRQYGLKGNFQIGDAERIPFKRDIFDFVSCDGVLHHTPDTQKGIDEIYRVLKKGGRAVISFYHQNWLLSKPIFPITLFLMRIMRVKTHGMKRAQKMTLHELVRMYDGIDNPLAKVKPWPEWENMLRNSGFVVKGRRSYYFPIRFLPIGKYFPKWTHRFLDRTCGTMMFFKVVKQL